jgi:hypothetical protein
MVAGKVSVPADDGADTAVRGIHDLQHAITGHCAFDKVAAKLDVGQHLRPVGIEQMNLVDALFGPVGSSVMVGMAR